jgi:hypothetical protein
MVTPDQIPATASAALTAADSGVWTTPEQCITTPAYGFDGSEAYECSANSYSQGWSREACTPCGVGLQTTGTGSTSPADCLAFAGWFKWRPTDTQASPCPVGSWSAAGASFCEECPKGST